MFHRILVPTDGSKAARSAVQAAIGMARLSGARLIALHVIAPEVPDVGYVGVDTLGAALPLVSASSDSPRPQQDSALGEAQAAAQKAGIPLEAEQRVDPQPAHAIVSVAEERACDLIVMASHGYGDLRSIITGSTTAKVVSGCDVPVLVVH